MPKHSLKKLFQSVVQTITLCLSALVLAWCCWSGVTPSASAMPLLPERPLSVFLSPSPLIASLFHFSGHRPTALGVRNGRLLPCPSTPNCVSSQTSDSTHRIASIAVGSTPAEAFNKLKTIIQGMSGAQIVEVSDRYLRAEFTSSLMGFVDDVEFYLDLDENAIQVRSASRLGESDLGVNRKRIETIRETLTSNLA